MFKDQERELVIGQGRVCARRCRAWSCCCEQGGTHACSFGRCRRVRGSESFRVFWRLWCRWRCLVFVAKVCVARNGIMGLVLGVLTAIGVSTARVTVVNSEGHGACSVCLSVWP